LVSATFGESDSGLTAAGNLFLIANRLPMLLLRLLSRRTIDAGAAKGKRFALPVGLQNLNR